MKNAGFPCFGEIRRIQGGLGDGGSFKIGLGLTSGDHYYLKPSRDDALYISGFYCIFWHQGFLFLVSFFLCVQDKFSLGRHITFFAHHCD